MRAVLVALLMLVALPAHAQTGKTSLAFVCDTQKIAERYIELSGQGVPDPRNEVTLEYRNPTACISMFLDYYTQSIVSFLRNSAGLFRITQILVLGVETTEGYRAVQTPSLFYKVTRSKDIGA
jgi:hypothetical protein